MAFATFDEVRSFLNHAIIHDTDGTNAAALLSGVTFPLRIDTWLAASIDTVAREFVVTIQDSSGTYQVITHFTVPAGAGTGGVPVFDVLAAILPATTQGLVLPPNQGVSVNALVALTAAKYAVFTVIGGIF